MDKKSHISNLKDATKKFIKHFTLITVVKIIMMTVVLAQPKVPAKYHEIIEDCFKGPKKDKDIKDIKECIQQKVEVQWQSDFSKYRPKPDDPNPVPPKPDDPKPEKPKPVPSNPENPIKEVEELQQRLKDTEEAKDKLNEQLNKYKNANRDLKETIKEKDDTISNLNDTIIKLVVKVIEAKERDSIQQLLIKNFETQVSGLEKDTASLRKQIRLLKNENDSLRKVIVRLEIELEYEICLRLEAEKLRDIARLIAAQAKAQEKQAVKLYLRSKEHERAFSVGLNYRMFPWNLLDYEDGINSSLLSRTRISVYGPIGFFYGFPEQIKDPIPPYLITNRQLDEVKKELDIMGKPYTDLAYKTSKANLKISEMGIYVPLFNPYLSLMLGFSRISNTRGTDAAYVWEEAVGDLSYSEVLGSSATLRPIYEENGSFVYAVATRKIHQNGFIVGASIGNKIIRLSKKVPDGAGNKNLPTFIKGESYLGISAEIGYNTMLERPFASIGLRWKIPYELSSDARYEDNFYFSNLFALDERYEKYRYELNLLINCDRYKRKRYGNKSKQDKECQTLPRSQRKCDKIKKVDFIGIEKTLLLRAAELYRYRADVETAKRELAEQMGMEAETGDMQEKHEIYWNKHKAISDAVNKTEKKERLFSVKKGLLNIEDWKKSHQLPDSIISAEELKELNPNVDVIEINSIIKEHILGTAYTYNGKDTSILKSLNIYEKVKYIIQYHLDKTPEMNSIMGTKAQKEAQKDYLNSVTALKKLQDYLFRGIESKGITRNEPQDTEKKEMREKRKEIKQEAKQKIRELKDEDKTEE